MEIRYFIFAYNLLKNLIFIVLILLLLKNYYDYRIYNNELVPKFKLINTVRYKDNFCFIENYWKGSDEYVHGEHVTLVLHSTIDFIPYLIEQLDTWTGGISIAVFMPTPHHDGNYSIINVMDTQIYFKVG